MFHLRRLALFFALVFGCWGQTGAFNILNGVVNIYDRPFTITLPNSATGTTDNKLAKTVVNGGVLQAQIITTSAADQIAALGCVISGGGNTGTATILVYGTGSCHFDGATTANNVAVPSSTSAGALHDTGSSATPTSGAGLAVIGSTNACGVPPCLVTGNLFAPLSLLAPGSGGPGGGGGSGNRSFEKITTGTNATAVMTLGTGSSLTTSGSGTNNANQFKGNATVAVADGGTGLTTAFARTAFIPAAECNNATASPAYDLPTTNAPTATCYGTSYRLGALDYDDAANETASFFFPLPTGWTGAIDFTGKAFVNATSQSLKLTVATVCIADSEDILNPSFNAAQTITVTSPGTANQQFSFTQTGLTTTGCAAGETLVVKVGRDTTDTSTATFSYTGTQLVLRITPQA